MGSEILKILGQVIPTAGVLRDLYTVPAYSSAVISSITICNLNNSTNALFRVSIAAGGDPDAPEQYLYYDLPLVNNDTFVATIGISLAMGDVVRIRSNVANVSFNLLGVEIGVPVPPPANMAGGDLTGYYPNPLVAGLQGNPVAPQFLGSLTDGYVLIWDNADGYWVAEPVPTQSGAVIFDDGVGWGPSENIRSTRTTQQSPINDTLQGIVNLSSDSTGLTTGVTGNFSTISGGDQNVITADYSTIGGGSVNSVAALYSVISGGFTNLIAGGYSSSIAGGGANTIVHSYSFLGGGTSNTIGSEWSVIGGGQSNTIATDTSVNSYTCSILGGYNNNIGTLSSGATIGGGYSNTIDSSSGYTVIAGGQSNTIGSSSGWVSIGGGNTNTVNGSYGTISGGSTNTVNAAYGAVVGGSGNSAGTYGVAGGNGCAATSYATAFGSSSSASATYSTCLGFDGSASGVGALCVGPNSAAGELSIAFGFQSSTTTLGNRLGQISTTSSGGQINSGYGDTQGCWLAIGSKQTTIGTSFVLVNSFFGDEFELEIAKYYNFTINIVITADNAAVGPAYMSFNVLAHIAGGFAVIDNQQQTITTPDPYTTGWTATITVDGTTNILHININPNGDVTNTLNATADIKWAEIIGFSQ